MDILSLNIRNLIENVENREKEIDVSTKQRMFAEKVFADRLKQLDGKFDAYAVQNALDSARFVSAECVCNELASQLGQSGKVFSDFLRFILTYNGFGCATAHEEIKKAFETIQLFTTTLKSTYGEHYFDYAEKLLNGEKAVCMETIFTVLGVDTSFLDFKEGMKRADQVIYANCLSNLDEIIDYHILSVLAIHTRDFLNEALKNSDDDIVEKDLNANDDFVM